jgi:predicted transcriptional regulator of viral defense system
MSAAIRYLDTLQARGVYTFLTSDMQRALGNSTAATRAVLRRLCQKHYVAEPYRSFYVIVPPEYRILGCLPAPLFVPALMKHLEEDYYVGLLSAAAYHGAAHQRPQVFQLVVPTLRRAIRCGEVQIDFIQYRRMNLASRQPQQTTHGVLPISSPEATALGLVGYPIHCGGMQNIATVLQELAETLQPELLRREAQHVPLSWVQRLGYLLSLLGYEILANALDELVQQPKTCYVALSSHSTTSKIANNSRWKLHSIEEIEVDL